MNLAEAGAAHAAVLAGIHAHAFPPGEAWDESAFATQLSLPGTFGLIDPRGGFILARVAADEAEVLTLAVMPDRRRTGVATALLAAAMARAAAQGARRMILEVAEANAAAIALYTRARFAAVGRRLRYYGGRDALILSVTLGCAAPAA